MASTRCGTAATRTCAGLQMYCTCWIKWHVYACLLELSPRNISEGGRRSYNSPCAGQSQSPRCSGCLYLARMKMLPHCLCTPVHMIADHAAYLNINASEVSGRLHRDTPGTRHHCITTRACSPCASCTALQALLGLAGSQSTKYTRNQSIDHAKNDTEYVFCHAP